ncbi:8568_t:CDS:1, partial [Gigaspora margarita]
MATLTKTTRQYHTKIVERNVIRFKPKDPTKASVSNDAEPT